MGLGGGGCDMDVPFKAQHSPLSYSLHVGKLWVSVLIAIMLNKEMKTPSISIIIKSQATMPTLCLLVYCSA